MDLEASPFTDDTILLTHLWTVLLVKNKNGGDWPGKEKYIT